MEPLLQRNILTGVVITAAEQAGPPIGDGEAPRGGVAGWQGQPNQDGTNFIPYSVITPMSVSAGTGPIADSQGDLIVPYAISSYGASRQQCEWMADAVRSAVGTMAQTDVTMYVGTPEEYQRRIQQVIEQQIGAVTRMPDTDPPYFGQTDVLALWTTR
jgi:hypothetical protein